MNCLNVIVKQALQREALKAAGQKVTVKPKPSPNAQQ
jgi:hypothetical protein